MSRDDGGPAFPCEQEHTPDGFWNHTFNPGMTLRDWFAGMVMVGDWAAQDEVTSIHERARLYYRMADAMLQARKEGEGE